MNGSLNGPAVFEKSSPRHLNLVALIIIYYYKFLNSDNSFKSVFSSTLEDSHGKRYSQNADNQPSKRVASPLLEGSTLIKSNLLV